MNNTQLYERNPEFIEMQTKAIMLQNRDGTAEEMSGQGSAADGTKMNNELQDSTCVKEKGRKGASVTSGNMAKSGMSSTVVPVGAPGQVPLLLTSGGSNGAQGAVESVVAAQSGPQLILPMYPTAPGAVVFQAGGVSHQTHPSMVFQAVAPAGTSPYQLPSQMVFSQPQTSASMATEYTSDRAPGHFSTSHRDSNTSLQSQVRAHLCASSEQCIYYSELLSF